ncbi:UDP-glucose 4-epimerase [Moorella thermoacetica]|uniref:UDP-glucose 4-epimerase n=1 Tax=Neomoorella thermoacetica TaxID=1525 RepID=A0A1J5NI93_NEOTH|nr:UDP-glucose 4-epimerase [Moorella thermoacetica]
MRILVTGGAGFIGSHVVEECLAAGYKVAVLDDLSSGRRENLPEGVALYQVDVAEAAAVNEVFQAAQISVSRSVREPAADARVNVLGLLNVPEALFSPLPAVCSTGMYGSRRVKNTRRCRFRPTASAN